MIDGYARVSTDGQSVAAQIKELRAAGAGKIFCETASGAKTDRAPLRRALAVLDADDELVIAEWVRATRSMWDGAQAEAHPAPEDGGAAAPRQGRADARPRQELRRQHQHDFPAGSVTDPSQWKPLSPAFTAALRAYDRASCVRLRNAEVRNAPTAPLYHYTNRGGLEGIITAQQFWFTHYKHLNDNTEIQFGMGVAKATLAELGARMPKVKIFCDIVIDLFSAENVNTAFGFYIASFSRNRDDLYQWRKYGQNGQGFAIGLAPKLFAIEDKPNRKPHENVFVSPVTYGADAGRILHLPAIESAARIVAETVERKAKAMSDINRGIPFFDEMAKKLLARELILNPTSRIRPRRKLFSDHVH